MNKLSYFAVVAAYLSGTAQAAFDVTSWFNPYECGEVAGGKYATRSQCCDANPQMDPDVGNGREKSLGCGTHNTANNMDAMDYQPETWDNTPINTVMCHVVDQYYIQPANPLEEPTKSCKVAYGDNCKNQPTWSSRGACCANAAPNNPYDVYDNIDGTVSTPHVCSDYDCSMSFLPGNKDESCEDESNYEDVDDAGLTACGGTIEAKAADGEEYQGGHFNHQYYLVRTFDVTQSDGATYEHEQIIKVSDAVAPTIKLASPPADMVTEENAWFRWETHGTGEKTTYAIDSDGCSEVSWPTPSAGEWDDDNCQDYANPIVEEWGDCQRSVGTDGLHYTWYCKHSYYTEDNAGNHAEFTYYMVKANCTLAESNEQYRKRAVFETK